MYDTLGIKPSDQLENKNVIEINLNDRLISRNSKLTDVDP